MNGNDYNKFVENSFDHHIAYDPLEGVREGLLITFWMNDAI
jgi:hypothetical protein